MRAHYLQHVPFEGPGSIEPWLRAAGYSVTSTPLYESGIFPELNEIDFLFIMGGPMSVNDEEQFPWLVAEKQYVRAAIESGKPVLGICLGAQLIANSLGAKVYRNPVPEIGWFPATSVESPGRSGFCFPSSFMPFHWHGLTFDLPSGAIHLARSSACEHQAFQIGSSVIGLQFHLETTPESARQIVSHCRDELVQSEFVQTEEELLSASLERYRAMEPVIGSVLEYLIQK